MSYVVAALYHFVDLADHAALLEPMKAHCQEHNITGTLLLAAEGINGTIAGTREDMDKTLAYLRKIPGFAALDHKESFCEDPPFFRLKIKLRKEIVTMRVDDVRPLDKVGQYIEPEDWNALISQEDVVLLDTRNDFEYRVGHFEGAIDPDTVAFAEFPDYVKNNLSPVKNKKVAMYCTGGIRCEKATSHLLEQGYEEVYHLKGGILKYLEIIPEEESLWKGECFVFDRRVSIGHGLGVGSFRLCHGCQSPLSAEQREHSLFEFGICCEYCSDTMTEARRHGLGMRLEQMKLAQSRGEKHIGMDKEQMYRRRKEKEAFKEEERQRQGHVGKQAAAVAPQP